MFSKRLVIGGSAGFASIADQKGDLLIGTADNVVGRVPVGADGTALFVDSTGTPPEGWRLPPLAQPPAVGDYFTTLQVSRSTGTVTAGTAYLAPIWIPLAMTLDRIGFEVTTADATATVRLGVYNHDLSTGRPGSRVLDAGSLSCSATGPVEATINQAMSPGIYWLLIAAQGTQTTLVVRSNGIVPFYVPGTTIAYGTGIQVGYTMTGVTGALPASASTATASSSGRLVYLRRSA